MIELTPLARPYAKALFASAVESNTLEDMAVELNTMAVASKENGVINIIENPTLSRQEIVDILVKLFEPPLPWWRRRRPLRAWKVCVITTLECTTLSGQARPRLRRRAASGCWSSDSQIGFMLIA